MRVAACDCGDMAGDEVGHHLGKKHVVACAMAEPPKVTPADKCHDLLCKQAHCIATHQPQLYTWLWLLLTATVYSAPQWTLLIALSCKLATASGTSRSFESPCPSWPSSPRPHVTTVPLPAIGA